MLLPIFFLVSSIPAGIALILIGSIVSDYLFGHSLSPKVLEKLGWLAPWGLGFYLALKLGELLVTEEIGLLFNSGIYSLLFWAELVIGVLIPIILFSISRVRWSRTGLLIAAMFMAGGIVMNRFNATWFAIKPLDGVIYFPSWLEVALLVGVASGVLLIFTLISHYFPVFSETVSSKKSPQPEASSIQSVQSPAGD
jgi:Ni/Fe-hydrogenase subunit HybB-like protein